MKNYHDVFEYVVIAVLAIIALAAVLGRKS